MPEGKFCNKTPIKTDEQLKATLNDKGGKQYYEDMNNLPRLGLDSIYGLTQQLHHLCWGYFLLQQRCID